MKSLIVLVFALMAWTVVQILPAGPPGDGPNGLNSGPPNGSGQRAPGGKPGEFGGGRGGDGGGGGPAGTGGGPGGGGGDLMLKQLMEMDVNGDGSLTPSEVTDPRLQAMLQPVDADGNGIVTLAELQSAMEHRPGPNGPGDRPRAGEILPGFMQDQLQLSQTQRQQIAELQAQVDAQLAQILSPQQLQQLAAGPQQPPMGFGGPGQNGNGSGRNGSANNGRGKSPAGNKEAGNNAPVGGSRSGRGPKR